MTSKYKLNKLKNILNDYRGISINRIFMAEEGEIGIEFSCSCKNSLLALLCHEVQPIDSTFYLGEEGLNYIIYIFNGDIDNYIYQLKEFKLEIPTVSEKFSSIPNFNKLTKASQRKYKKFVKFLRNQYSDGAITSTAQEVLLSERYCGCGEEVYSTADETRAVLEFDDPEDAYEALMEE